jgi:hypothetical protein
MTRLGGLNQYGGLNHYNFWDVKDHPHDPLVRDTGRHKQVNAVNVMDLRNTNGSGWSTGLPDGSLQLAAQSMIGLPRTTAELSERRKHAMISAFRRVDVTNVNRVGAKELTAGLQRYSNLSAQDQSSLVGAILTHSGVGGAGEISLAHFAAYYTALGMDIRRDRDLEDIIRRHWGFAEVEDILDDMKNKFSILGLAYATQKSPSVGGDPTEYTPRSFQSAISNVGISYQATDVDRVFKSLSPVGNKKISTLELTQHLTSAPRPATPEGPFDGPLTHEPNAAPFERQALSPSPGFAQLSPWASHTGSSLSIKQLVASGGKIPRVETAPPECQPSQLPDDATSTPFTEEPDAAPPDGARRGQPPPRTGLRDLRFSPCETAPPESQPIGIDAAVGGSSSSSPYDGPDEPDQPPFENQYGSRPSPANAFQQLPMSRHGLYPGMKIPRVETAPPEVTPNAVDNADDNDQQQAGQDSYAPPEGGSRFSASSHASPQAGVQPWRSGGFRTQIGGSSGTSAFPPPETAPPEEQPSELDASVIDN